VILSISETVSKITQGDSFTVIASVTDPMGLSNLVGGQLISNLVGESQTVRLVTLVDLADLVEDRLPYGAFLDAPDDRAVVA
jgi:hypothetical protein